GATRTSIRCPHPEAGIRSAGRSLPGQAVWRALAISLGAVAGPRAAGLADRALAPLRGSLTAPLTCGDSGSLDRTGPGEAKPGNGDGRRWPCGLTEAMARARHRGHGAGQWIIWVAPGTGHRTARCAG